jgi:hypothetical protein
MPGIRVKRHPLAVNPGDRPLARNRHQILRQFFQAFRQPFAPHANSDPFSDAFKFNPDPATLHRFERAGQRDVYRRFDGGSGDLGIRDGEIKLGGDVCGISTGQGAQPKLLGMMRLDGLQMAHLIALLEQKG